MSHATTHRASSRRKVVSRPALPALTALSAALLGLTSLSAQAQDATLFSVVRNPPVFQGEDNVNAASGGSGIQAQGNVSEATLPPARQRNVRLDVGYVDSYIWDPNNDKYDRVRLRSYHGDSSRPLVAPTIEIQPGTRLNVKLTNNLEPDPDKTCKDAKENDPRCFNVTNLHTHGLWVSPRGNSDNIFLKVEPGQSQLYEIDVPSDHPAGTFWYHSHFHGSTALQVSSGMAGALIIRGNRYPSGNTNGDLDTLLKSTPGTRVQERLLMLQQISYGCVGTDGKLKRMPANGGENQGQGATTTPLRCDDGDVGSVDNYDALDGPNSWRDSGRFTTVNGVTLPRFVGAVAGRLERWRIIHGGVRDSVNLEFRKAVLNNMPVSDVRNLSGKALQRFINNNCTGAPLTHYRVASDGMTMDSMQPATQTTFQPGYRWDLVTVFPQSGFYCVLDKSVPAAGAVNNEPPAQTLIGIVEVGNGVNMNVTDIPSYVKQQMLNLANTNAPESVRANVVADLNDGLKLSRYTPHKTLTDADVTESTPQTVTYAIVPKNPNNRDEGLNFTIDGKVFSETDEPRTLKLGAVQDWIVKSTNGGHPHHVHVNPFQIVSILDPQGRDVSGLDTPDTAGSEGGVADTQYRGMKGTWRDTLFIKSLPGRGTAGQYTVTVRTQYNRYWGDFVLHCHILDHEDRGMMQKVRIYDPANPIATRFGPVPICGLDDGKTKPFATKFKSPYGVSNPLLLRSSSKSKIQASIMATPVVQ